MSGKGTRAQLPTLRVSAPSGGWCSGVKGKWGVSVRAPLLLLLPRHSHTRFRSNRPGARPLQGWWMAVSCSVCHQGASGQRTSGPQLPEPDHPQASSWLGGSGPGSLCPTVAYRNFTLSLGIRGLRGGGRVCNIPLGPWVVPCPETGDHCLPRLPGARLTPARSAGHYLPTLSSQGGLARKQCSVPFPSPVSPVPWVLAVVRGSSTST